MITALGKPRSHSLMAEYSSMLGDAALRSQTRRAEQMARIEAEFANRIRSEFVSNMSHELRTPLNTMLGFSKLLREHQDRRLADDDIVQYAALIHDAASHLLSVINDILDISKLKSGRYTLKACELDLKEILAAAIQDQAEHAARSRIALDLTLDGRHPTIHGDREKLQQAFSNLINNAIKVSDPQGHVASIASCDVDGCALVTIRDTGVGMSEDEVQVALADFGQVDGGHARWREGTGLGLPIARALIELHGGSLRIRSQKSKGTDVLVWLPDAANQLDHVTQR